MNLNGRKAEIILRVAIQPLIIEYDRTKPNEEIENEEIESDPKR
jgi:hypothetical protein